YEIKHFSGDFFMNQDKWYLASNKQEIRNPLIQLQRSEFLLRELLKPKHPNLNIQARSEEHTSELQSRFDIVCRLLLEKKKLIKREGHDPERQAQLPVRRNEVAGPGRGIDLDL